MRGVGGCSIFSLVSLASEKVEGGDGRESNLVIVWKGLHVGWEIEVVGKI